jgi:glycosyltransferase involved in cell wall biosynthesis
MMPTVSVIIPSYNHGEYIRECIQSVLDQTYQDFEIVITDDSSSDRSVEVIQSFDDARIKLFRHLENKGACATANNCILNSNGKYIAMLSSDDAWYPEKLEVQVRYIEKHPEIAAVFGKVDWIDENGDPLLHKNFSYSDVFNVKNRSRHEWLNHFFYMGNCLCHPSSLIRRECYDNVGMLNPAFSGLPDFDLWIRIFFKYEIRILDKKLIRYRWIGDKNNTSGDTNSNRIRNRFENLMIFNNYLKIKDLTEFLLIFPEAVKYGKLVDGLIPYYLGRLAIDSGPEYKVLWGLSIIYNLLQDDLLADILEKQYDFTYSSFSKFTSMYDVFRITSSIPTYQGLSVPRRSGFRAFLSASKRYLQELHLIISESLGK